MVRQNQAIILAYAERIMKEKGMILTPFIPSIGIERRFELLKTEMLPAESIFGSFQNYTMDEMMRLQLKRIGFTATSGSFSNSIMTIYGMMLAGAVIVGDNSTMETKVYTLNPFIASQFVGKDVSCLLPSILEDIEELKKNTISCFEIDTIIYPNGQSTYKCFDAVFNLNMNSQTIAFLSPIAEAKRDLLKLLQSKLLNIEFYDMGNKCNKTIQTTLSSATFSKLSSKEEYSQIIRNCINGEQFMTLHLPDLSDFKNNSIVPVYIPSIIQFTYTQAGIYQRPPFKCLDTNTDPVDEKKGKSKKTSKSKD